MAVVVMKSMYDDALGATRETLEELRQLLDAPEESAFVRDGRRQSAVDYRLRLMSATALASIADSLAQLVTLTAERT